MKRSEIPSLDDLRAFESTARLGTGRLAAEELALTHGAISRRINKLSNDLGISLFDKDGRGLKLTAEGETLYLTVNRFLQELETTVKGLRAASASENALVLSCEPSVAMRWLIPRLPDLQTKYPDVTVHLSVGGGPLDFRRDRVDLAIRRLDFAIPESWHVRRLFAEKVGPVMTSDIIEEFESGNFIGLGTRTRVEAWPDWLANGNGRFQPKEIRYHDHHFLMVEAASVGLGVALSPKVLAMDEIEKGRLLAPVGFEPDGSFYGVIWSKHTEMSSKGKKVIDWLTQETARAFGTAANVLAATGAE